MNETRKWILHRVTAIIVAPLYAWFYFSLVSLSTKNYTEAIYFFTNPLFKILAILLFFVSFIHIRISNQKNIKINASRFMIPEIL